MKTRKLIFFNSELFFLAKSILFPSKVIFVCRISQKHPKEHVWLNGTSL